MRKLQMSALAFGLVMLLTSCALIFKGETQDVPVASMPEGAEVYIDGVYQGTTPLQVNLRSDSTYIVTLRLDDQERVVTLRNEVGTLWVVLDVLSGLVPLIIDAATGAWYELQPGQVNVVFN
jgi:hypothetical protein